MDRFNKEWTVYAKALVTVKLDAYKGVDGRLLLSSSSVGLSVLRKLSRANCRHKKADA